MTIRKPSVIFIKFAMKAMSPEPVVPPLEGKLIAQDVSCLRRTPSNVLFEKGNFAALWFQREDAPALFHELCRQREITFRLSGQGTGAALDETPEDHWYHQLVLWDLRCERIAGAYRVGSTSEILPRIGVDGLYLSHMFEFAPEFFERHERSLELSRSFVVADYQNNQFALPLLWRGLGEVVKILKAGMLFGSVTLAADFSEKSRGLVVDWLVRHRCHQPCALARALRPFSNHELPGGWNPDRAIEKIRESVTDTEGRSKPIPTLLRHYLRLGASFHDFHVESSFNDALYCLLEIDVNHIPDAHRRRFIA